MRLVYIFMDVLSTYDVKHSIKKDSRYIEDKVTT